MSEGRSTYNALQVDLNRRFNDGVFVRGVYTLASAMDDGDSLNATAASNAVALLSNPYNPMADWGPATYDVRHAATVSVMYALPLGRHLLLSGWTLNSIVNAQTGFPLTPQLSYNPANNGDTRNPVRPFLNPAFTGSIVTGEMPTEDRGWPRGTRRQSRTRRSATARVCNSGSKSSTC